MPGRRAGAVRNLELHERANEVRTARTARQRAEVAATQALVNEYERTIDIANAWQPAWWQVNQWTFTRNDGPTYYTLAATPVMAAQKEKQPTTPKGEFEMDAGD